MSLFINFLFLFISPSFSAFIAPITKHHVKNTPFYTLKVQLKTPLEPTYLLLDTAATFTAVNCRRNYTSTTSRPVPCNSTLCHSLQSKHSNTTRCKTSCVISDHKSFALVDSLALQTTDGRNPGLLTTFPGFVFKCWLKSKSIKGPAKKVVKGLAGLGFSNYSLPAQVSTSTSVFSLCLSGSPSAPGVAFFGLAKPYYFLPGIDISDHLYYTPIFAYLSDENTTRKTKTKTKRYKDAYYIRVKSVNVNGRPIIINQTLLTSGTRISTTDPYTVLETSIFRALLQAFKKESTDMKLKAIRPIKPFRLCYEADGLSETHLGPNVPSIDFVMQNDVSWRVLGKNSMVRIVDESLDVWCLAMVDGGVGSGSAMVIGGHQLEDNLIQFDLRRKVLGFSSTLLQHKTMCANFNFSTNSNIKL